MSRFLVLFARGDALAPLWFFFLRSTLQLTAPSPFRPTLNLVVFCQAWALTNAHGASRTKIPQQSAQRRWEKEKIAKCGALHAFGPPPFAFSPLGSTYSWFWASPSRPLISLRGKRRDGDNTKASTTCGSGARTNRQKLTEQIFNHQLIELFFSEQDHTRWSKKPNSV